MPENVGRLTDVQGGLYTGDATSLAALNKPFWARLTSSDEITLNTTPDAIKITAYGWVEQAWGVPGTPSLLSTDGPLVDLPGGRLGTISGKDGATETVNPAIDLAGNLIVTNTAGEVNNTTTTYGNNRYVLIRRAYYDPNYDWVYVILCGSVDSFAIIKMDVFDVLFPNEPTPAGFYSGKRQTTEQAKVEANSGLPAVEGVPCWILFLNGPGSAPNADMGRQMFGVLAGNANPLDSSLEELGSRPLYLCYWDPLYISNPGTNPYTAAVSPYVQEGDVSVIDFRFPDFIVQNVVEGRVEVIIGNTPTCYQVPGANSVDVPISHSPSYVLGYDSSGCLVKVPVSTC
jgi:hypothetical protein